MYSLLDADLAEEVDGTRTAAAEGTNDKNLDVLDTALDSLKGTTNVRDHGVLVGVGLEVLEDTVAAVLLLLGVGKSTGGGTSETGVEAESGNTAAGLGVLEELEVVELAVAAGEATENVVPAALLLVAVGKLDVGVGEGVAAGCESGTDNLGGSSARWSSPINHFTLTSTRGAP